MCDKPLVSYIVGVYNTKNFDDLDRSIDSMLHQTYSNIEIVICDDASNNGVFEYLTSKYRIYSNIILVRNKKNSGLGTSLNHCLEVASGKYIARHDDDDYIDITKLQKQVDFLEHNPSYSFVSTGYYKFDAEGIWGDYQPMERPGKRDFRIHSQHVHAATLFTRECLDAVHGYRIAPETRRAEDYDLFMRLYAAGYNGYNIQEKLYYYNYPRGNKRIIKYRYKMMEAIVRAKGFYWMKLPIQDYVFVVRPLIAGILSENTKLRIKRILRGKRE